MFLLRAFYTINRKCDRLWFLRLNCETRWNIEITSICNKWSIWNRWCTKCTYVYSRTPNYWITILTCPNLVIFEKNTNIFWFPQQRWLVDWSTCWRDISVVWCAGITICVWMNIRDFFENDFVELFLLTYTVSWS